MALEKEKAKWFGKMEQCIKGFGNLDLPMDKENSYMLMVVSIPVIGEIIKNKGMECTKMIKE